MTILSISPLSQSYLNEVKSILAADELQLINFSELRRKKIVEIIKLARSLNPNVLFLGLEDKSSKALIGLLLIFGTFTKAKVIKTIDSEFSISKISKWKIVPSIFDMIISSFLAIINLIYCKYESNNLNKQERAFYKSKGDKILYLKTNLWFGVKIGGSIGHVSGVINGFNETGKIVHFYGTEEPLMINVELQSHIFSPIKKLGIPQELNLYTLQRNITKQLLNIFKDNKEKYLFIYSRMSVANYCNVLLSRLLKVPLILEYNGSEVWIFEKWGSGLIFPKVAKVLEEVCLKHAHIIVVISEVLRDELIERGIERDKIVFYPNCIDPKIFDINRFTNDQIIELKQKYLIDKDAKVATFIGTFGQWHGVEIFAKAIRWLCLNEKEWLIKYKVHFLLVGDGLKMQEVKNEILNDYCEDFITLTGLIPQHLAPIHLASSDLLVSPHIANSDGTKFFGSPTKLFEYMAMQKGIVASDLDQIGDVLRNSLNVTDLPDNNPDDSNTELAILTEPGNYKHLVKAIKFLVENPRWNIKLGENSRKEAYSKYTWENHVKQILLKFNQTNDSQK